MVISTGLKILYSFLYKKYIENVLMWLLPWSEFSLHFRMIILLQLGKEIGKGERIKTQRSVRSLLSYSATSAECSYLLSNCMQPTVLSLRTKQGTSPVEI
jgi:hypothetical protein